MRTFTGTPRILGASTVATIVTGAVLGAAGLATQQAKLAAVDAQYGDRLGFSVALSGDTAVAGATSSNSDAGAAYVFARTGTNWTQEAKLVAADAASDDLFGLSVAVAGDTAAVAANYKHLSRGAVYVFTRSGGVWTQQTKLMSSDAAPGDRLGISVAIAGNTIVAGAFARSTSRGAAYVFTRSGTAWSEQATLTASDAADYDQFGISVGVAGDTVVVGASNHGAGRGAAYVFARTGTTWAQQAVLTASDAAAGDQLGLSVAASGDTALAGAPTKNSLRGAAYVFTRTGATWAQQAKLTASDAASGDLLGTSVGVSGGAAAVGAYGKDSARGAAYVFTRTATTWTETSKLAAADGAGSDDLGFSVAVSGDTAVAGAWGSDSFKGAAYVFSPLVGAGAPAGFVLPTKVTAKANAKHPERSTLTASGTLDTGGDAPDFSGAAAFDVGGFRLDVPAFVAKGKSLTFGAGGVTLTITPAKSGTSRAVFSAKAVGDFAGRVDREGPLAFHFKNAAHDLSGTATLTKGALGPHCVTAPELCLRSAAATLKGAGKDALTLTLGFATDGAVPAAGERDMTVGFGGAYTSPLLSGAAFVRKRSAYVLTAKAPGITKATVDYAKGTITIAGSRLDLGAFVAGANPVVVTITRGGETRTVEVRMSRAGAKLSY